MAASSRHICRAGRRDAAGVGGEALRRAASFHLSVNGGIEADPAGDYQASSRFGESRNRARRSLGSREPLRIRSAADSGNQEYLDFVSRTVGSGTVPAQVVRRRLRCEQRRPNCERACESGQRYQRTPMVIGRKSVVMLPSPCHADSGIRHKFPHLSRSCARCRHRSFPLVIRLVELEILFKGRLELRQFPHQIKKPLQPIPEARSKFKLARSMKIAETSQDVSTPKFGDRNIDDGIKH